MCGFIGLINLQENFINKDELSRMLMAIHHRGPDEQGIHQANNVILGFKRLSIIDLKGGSQPMISECGNYSIIFNGEIYNYIELREELHTKGFNFKTNSDTEVIMNSYREYGDTCVTRLRGMFAFAILDLKKNLIFCARDGFGIKPFYYHENNDCILFSSELKALKATKKLNFTISPLSLDNYFTFGYVPRQYSIYKEVKKLNAGNSIKFYLDGRKSQLKEYWSPSFKSETNYSEEKLIELLDSSLKESVQKHLISDVDVGAFLSGGIDSSIVTAMAAKASRTKLKTFSIGFDNAKYNELPYAKIVSELYNTEHHELIVQPEDISILSNIVKMTDEPFADSSILPTFFVSKLASQSVKVVLSGDGGDELFGGYNMYDKMLRLKNAYYGNNLPFVRKLFLRLAKVLPYTSNYKRLAYFLSKEVDYIAAYTSLWTQIDRPLLYNPDFCSSLKGFLSETVTETMIKLDLELPFIDRIQKFNMQFVLVDDILTKVDRASMNNSLEVRVPILDKEIQKISAITPFDIRFKNREKKYILKKVAEKYIPKEVIYRKKQGFSVPLEFWFKNSLYEYLNDEIMNSNSSIYNYIDRNFIKNIIEINKSGKVDYSSHIWSIVIFHNWLKLNS